MDKSSLNRYFSGLALSIMISVSNLLAQDTPATIRRMANAPKFFCTSQTSGRVEMLVDVDKKGKPFNMRLTSTGVATRLTNRSLHQAGKWRFNPATRNGAPINYYNFAAYYNFNCSGWTPPPPPTPEEVARAEAQRAYEARYWAYVAACKDPDGMACMAKARLQAAGLPVPADPQPRFHNILITNPDGSTTTVTVLDTN